MSKAKAGRTVSRIDRSKLVPTVMALAVVAAFAGGNAQAANCTWDGSSSDSWGTTNNWTQVGTSGSCSNGPSGSDIATINTSGSRTPTLGSSVTTAGLIYSRISNGLDLNDRTLTITGDYNNTNFGTGNSFDPYANITTGSGAINAGTSGSNHSPNTFQQLSVDGGSKTSGNTTLALGNVRIGGSASKNYQIFDMAGSGGVTLRGAIKGSGIDSQLSGTGVDVTTSSWTATPGNNPSGVSKTVAMTGVTAGAVSSHVTILNNFANTNSQVLTITGAVYRLAAPSTIGSPVTLANIREGGTFAALSRNVTNDAASDGYSEKLDATIGSLTGGATGSGSISQLAAGSSSSALSFGLGGSTAVAGSRTGTVQVNFASNGNGTSGITPVAPLASQTVTVNGAVYRLAAPSTIATPVDLGIIHIGDSFASHNLALANNAANDGYSESLNASFGTPTGDVTTNLGSISLLGAGATNNTAMAVNLNGSGSAGARSGTVAVNLESDGSGTSGFSALALTPQTVTVNGQVNNYAAATFAFDSGVNGLSGGGISYTFDFGSIYQGAGPATGYLSLTNTGGIDFTDSLNPLSFVLTGTGNYSLTGNAPVLLAGGVGVSGIGLILSDSLLGSQTGTLTLNWSSNNASGNTAMDPISIALTGNVMAPVPEPESWAMFLAGIGVVGAIVRRRRSRVEA